MRIGIHYCREFAEGQRKDEVILNDDTDLYMGMTDLKKSTMCLIGDKGTGTRLHADISTGQNYAMKIIPPPLEVKV